MPVQKDVAPRRRRHLFDKRQHLRVAARLALREQPRQDGGVVVDDGVGDQPCALVADFDFDVGPASQFLLAAIFERILTVILAGGIFGGSGLHPQNGAGTRLMKGPLDDLR